MSRVKRPGKPVKSGRWTKIDDLMISAEMIKMRPDVRVSLNARHT